jgi:hypothetical protein
VPLAAKSRRGYRDVRSIEKYPINQGLLDQWEHLILTILDSKTERMLKLTKDGFELFQLNRANWERKLDVEDNYLDGYGNRLFGNLITIAMIFTLMMNPDQNEFIDDQALFMALALADPLIAHRRLADNLKFEQRPEIRVLDKLALWMDEIDDERNQQGVDVWMRNQDYRINKREFHMRMKGQNWLKIGGIDALDKALKELASNSWLELDSGDHEIFPNPYLREHHRDKFRATNVPLQSENATKMPL